MHFRKRCRRGVHNGDVIMGLNEHQRGHETPKTLFNALRLSPPRGVIAHVSPQFPTCRNPGKQSYFRPTSFPPPTLAQFGDKKRAETSKFLPPRPVSNTFRCVASLEKTRSSGQLLSRRPHWPSLGDKKRAETSKFLPPRTLRPVSNTFRRVASRKALGFSGQRSRDRPHWPSLGEKSASARRNSCRRYPFAPFPTRFALFLTCRNPGKHSHFGPTLKRSPTLGHTFCQETQNRPAIRKPPSGIFARRRTISSQKFPAVAVSPPPVLPARHACRYSSSA